MSAAGYEIRSRSLTLDGAKRTYYVYDAPDEEDIADFIESLPSSIAGFDFASFEANEIEDSENCDEWTVVVTWGTPDYPSSQDAGTSTYKFSFQAQGAHIKRSLSTVAAYEDTNIFTLGAPPMQGAINIVDYGTPEVHAEGVDLQPPPESFTIVYSDIDSVITSAYQSTVRDLCGKVNNTSFLGYAAGQIMLVRVDGQRSGGLWNLEFGFAYIPNQTSIPVGDNIVVTSKDGMDLLWAMEITQNDYTTKALVNSPACAYVERVWYRADLNDLALPAL